MSKEIPPFPGDDEDETDNVIPSPPRAVPDDEEEHGYDVSIAQEKQEQATDEIVEILVKHRGDITTLGGLMRRYEIERYVGHAITEEEFIAIARLISSYALQVVGPIFPLLAAEAHRQVTNQ